MSKAVEGLRRITGGPSVMPLMMRSVSERGRKIPSWTRREDNDAPHVCPRLDLPHRLHLVLLSDEYFCNLCHLFRMDELVRPTK